MGSSSQTVRGRLYKLHDTSRGGVGSPLLRKIPVEQSVLAEVSKRAQTQNVSPTPERNLLARRESFRRTVRNLAVKDESSGGSYRVLGQMIHDWHMRHFEMDFKVAELRYSSERISNGTESRHAPGMKTVGFVQNTTTTKEGPMITTQDNDSKTGEKLSLWTFEVTFFNLSTAFSGERTFVLGHENMEERDRWMQLIQRVTEEKSSLERGMRSYFQLQKKVWADSMDEWEMAKRGEFSNQVNLVAKRKARLLNGKVFNDVNAVFDKLSKPIEAPGETYNGDLAMRTEEVILGLTGLPEGHADRVAFKEIFNECFQDMTTKPSDQVKTRLMQIMAKSKNPFLQLLTTEEKQSLIEGRDSETGRPNCNFKTFTNGSILVSQGEEGNSMFIIVDGELSVIVSFGGDGTSPAQRKEVAVLPSGAVMGEMSLVLDKARSATCAVKSASCSVAEITKGAMNELMKIRPHLARELEEMVHRRDTANYLAADSAAAMAAYRKRGAKAPSKLPADAVAGGRGGGGAAGNGGGGKKGAGESGDEEEAQVAGRQKKKRVRIKTRLTKKARPSLAASWPWPQAGGAGGEPGTRDEEGHLILPQVKGAAGFVKTGRWIRCRDGYLLAYD